MTQLSNVMITDNSTYYQNKLSVIKTSNNCVFSKADLRAISMLKNAPNQADNFANFSVMLLSENQLFSSSVGSDLQANKGTETRSPRTII